MDRDIDGAKEYMRKMYHACGQKLTEAGLYGGKTGHLRLAREIGAALNDFSPAGQKEILSGSYSVIYVRACSLRPVLDAKEWISAMMAGKEAKEKRMAEDVLLYDFEPDEGYER